MYRRPKFLEILDEIREEMSREADYDVDLFAEMVRNGEGKRPALNEKTEDDTSVRTLILKDLAKLEPKSNKT